MSAPKVMTVYGTRPEAIKVAPVIKALEADPRFESIAVTTGQHRQMLDQVNTQFGITPAFDLDIMRPGQTLNGIVARAIAGLDEVIEKVQPDVIISQGDTSTAMAAAIAGFNRGVKIVHLEAGLRTGNILSPFPEEANRRIIGQVASLHLAPTNESKRNLQREDFRSADIVVAGNSVIDALLEATTWNTTFTDERLQQAAESDARIVLFTTHRRENLDAMSNIGKAMARLATEYPEIVFVLPAHLNPKVRAAVFPEIEGCENILVTDPLPYNEFTKLMARAHIVLTDSGGVQEEAPALGKPVLVMRENTERPEAVTAGTVRLIGTDEDRIVSEAMTLLDTPAVYEAMANAVNPYGDGKAAARTVAAIAELLGFGERLPDFNPVEMQS
ncbi:non-hydrolyzing UDP-N-acetylglucosamine 2-epimerase [Corynebacterium sp. H130]|uniref:non-hydrolyzing UDP-N-acetylglucosamine 2-epimerase n=1 Tax=Corynebacterium sp. H130 TaxID=3133444 RepID=UPI0030A43C6D